jgi:hypothetical protein
MKLIRTPKYLAALIIFSSSLLLNGYTELPGEVMSADKTLPAGTYLVTGTIIVPEGRTLFLAPGAVLKFNSWWHRIIVDGGTIIADGQMNNPVIFTSNHDGVFGEAFPDATTAGPDQWGGIVLQRAGGSGTPATGTFFNCRFRFGGGYTRGMIESTDCPFTVDACSFEQSGEDGIFIVGGPSLAVDRPEIRTSSFTGNRRTGIYAIQPQVPEKLKLTPLIRENSFAGNIKSAMELYHNVYPDFAGTNQLVQQGGVVNGILWNGSSNTEGILDYPGPNFPYVLTGLYEIQREASLTIAAGAIIKANSWWHRITAHGASITVNGTDARPVIFTSYQDDSAGGDTNGDGGETQPGPDQWGGVLLLPSADDDRIPSSGQFTYSEFRYGGGYTSSMLGCDEGIVSAVDCLFMDSKERGAEHLGTAAHPANGSFIRCDFRNNGTVGAYIRHIPDDGVSLPVFTDCVFEGNGTFAAELSGNVFPVTGRSNTLIPVPDTTNGVAFGHAITQSGTYPAFGPDFPYVLNGTMDVPYGVTLTFGPGAVVKANSWWHRFEMRGDLVVEGTEADLVVFTSIHDDDVAGDTDGKGAEPVAAPDQWGGIRLSRQEGAPESGSLSADFMTMLYGGGYTSALIQSDGGAIDLENCVIAHSNERGIYYNEMVNGGPVSLVGCTFRDNLLKGVEIRHESGVFNPVIHGCTFSGNAGYAMELIGDIFPDFDGQNLFAQGMDGSLAGIAVAGTVEVDGTLEFPGDPAPYILGGTYTVQSGAHLTIEPGVVVKGDSWWNRFDMLGGHVTAEGTADLPIVFTSIADDAVAGDTNGDADESSAEPDHWGGFRFDGEVSTGSFAYCIFNYGGGYTSGLISVNNSEVTANYCEFAHSGEHGIYGSGTASVVVRDSSISDCKANGATMASATHMLDLRSNFWGHSSGPIDNSDAVDLVKSAGYISYHPDAFGEKVSNNVIYDGWLESVPSWDTYLWADATDYGNGWCESSWYGWFNDIHYPYILHLEHDWQVCFGDSQQSIYLYDYGLRSWIWISRDLYPYIYKYGLHESWYLYFKGGKSPNRWFYSYLTGGFVNESDLRQ